MSNLNHLGPMGVELYSVKGFLLPVHRPTDGRTVGRSDGRTNGRSNGRTDGRTDERTVTRCGSYITLPLLVAQVALGFEFHHIRLAIARRGRPGAWFQSRKATWRNIARSLDLGEDAVRKSLPYTQRNMHGSLAAHGVDDSAVLNVPSISTRLLLCVAIDSAYSQSNGTGLVQQPSARDAFKRLAQGVSVLATCMSQSRCHCVHSLAMCARVCVFQRD